MGQPKRRIEMHGESMRKKNKAKEAASESTGGR
jgi:hypothetical protein